MSLRVLQFDLIVFVVYTTDEDGYNHYMNALASNFPRACIGSPLGDFDVDVDAFTESVVTDAEAAAAGGAGGEAKDADD